MATTPLQMTAIHCLHSDHYGRDGLPICKGDQCTGVTVACGQGMIDCPRHPLCSLLLTDDDGDARVYSSSSAGTTLASTRLALAERMGDAPYGRAWLVLPDGDVVPAKVGTSQTPWDSDARATVSVRFEPADPQYRGVYGVRYDLDGLA